MTTDAAPALDPIRLGRAGVDLCAERIGARHEAVAVRRERRDANRRGWAR